MSVRKWAYTPEKCDGDFCPGRCDDCSKVEEGDGMTLDEAIKHCEEVAEEHTKYNFYGGYESCDECAKEHRQLAEWLRELKIHREIHDVLLQTFVDFDLDICCEDLMDNEEEQKICEENCDNKTKSCWVRWAKLKAREVKVDGGEG